jgi:iron-sulfur cluster assembly protein
MPITLTPAALDHVRRFLGGRPDAALRFGVKRTGCSGWGYVVDFAEGERPGDTRFEVEGVAIVVDADSLPLVDGTEIDYRQQGLNRAFAFANPQATAECGCGESFTTRPEHA